MAIAYDNNTTGQALSASSASWSHTCTGSDLILFVMCETQDTAGVTSVTYNGVSLTQIGTNVTAKSGGNRGNLWYLIAPASGSNTVQINRAGSTGWIGGGALSYTGVKQTTPIDVSGNSSGVSSPITHTLTTTVDNDWSILVAGTTGGSTASTNSTSRTAFNDHVNWYDNSGAGPISPAGSYNMQATTSNSWQSIMVAFFTKDQPPSGPANLKSWNGLAKASIKSINGLAIASIKSINGLG